MAKTASKKVVFSVEGTDIDFNEYIDGTRVKFDLGSLKKKKNEESKEESDDSEDLDEYYMIDYESEVVKKCNIPFEPKLFPLFVNGQKIDFTNVDDDDDQNDNKSSQKRYLSEAIQFMQMHNFH